MDLVDLYMSSPHTLRQRWQRGGPAVIDWVIRVLYRDPCSYCGGPAWTVDHIEPIVRGGTANPTNLTAACAACNRGKDDASLLEFLLAR